MNNKFFTKVVTLVLMAAMVSGLTACSDRRTTDKGSSKKYTVVTTIFPEYDWVREIVGQGQLSVDKSAADDFDVKMLLDNGADLHSFQPGVADIALISTCDMFIYVGGESDTWVDETLKTAINKDMIVINLMDILKDEIKEEDGEGHHHEEGEIEYDEHVWLSIRDSMTICNYIKDELVKLDKDDSVAFYSNLNNYSEKLKGLDNEYKDTVDLAKNKTLVFGDRFPFRYLADDYGLDYYAAFAGCSAETEASFDTIIFLTGKVDELGLGAICTTEDSNQKLANTIKENTKTGDQEILTFNSLQSATSKDVDEGVCYYSEMKNNLEVLKKALGE